MNKRFLLVAPGIFEPAKRGAAAKFVEKLKNRYPESVVELCFTGGSPFFSAFSGEVSGAGDSCIVVPLFLAPGREYFSVAGEPEAPFPCVAGPLLNTPGNARRLASSFYERHAGMLKNGGAAVYVTHGSAVPGAARAQALLKQEMRQRHELLRFIHVNTEEEEEELARVLKRAGTGRVKICLFTVFAGSRFKSKLLEPEGLCEKLTAAGLVWEIDFSGLIEDKTAQTLWLEMIEAGVHE